MANHLVRLHVFNNLIRSPLEVFREASLTMKSKVSSWIAMILVSLFSLILGMGNTYQLSVDGAG
jgi:hypothetical protein